MTKPLYVIHIPGDPAFNVVRSTQEIFQEALQRAGIKAVAVVSTNGVQVQRLDIPENCIAIPRDLAERIRDDIDPILREERGEIATGRAWGDWQQLRAYLGEDIFE